MNIKTFLACATMLPATVSVLIQGGHGIGKSALTRRLARTLKTKEGKPLRLIDKRLSQLTEGDIIGLPKMNDAKGVTEWFPPDWIKVACEIPCLVFLDEGNRATGEVMQASFQLVLDRELNGNHLHPETRVFMAINNDTRIYQVADLDPAYRDRFWQCELTPTAEEWLEWARDTSPEGGNIHQLVTNFIVTSHTSLDPSPAVDTQEKQPSRRSWERFNNTVAPMGWFDNDWTELAEKGGDIHDQYMHLAHGFLGRDVGNGFMDFVKTQKRRLNAEDVLDRWNQNEDRIVQLSQAETNVLIDRLVTWCSENTLNEDQAKAMGKFFKVLPGELKAACWQEIAKHHSKTTVNLKLMHEHIKHHIIDAIGQIPTAAATTPTK